MLIDKYLEYLENVKTCSRHTLKAYRTDLIQALGEQVSCTENPGKLLSAAKRAMTQWSALSPSSRNRKTAVLKSYFRWLFETGIVSEAIGEKLISPKVPQKIPRVLSVEEITSLFAVTRERDVDPRARVLLMLLYGCGLRISEAVAARWADLQSGGILRVRGKGSKERLVPLPAKVRSEFSRATDRKARIVTPDISERQAYQLIRDLGARAGLLKPIHPHALRHSFATHLLSGGSDLRILQELLGHESLAATQKYTHLNLDQLARTMESFHPFGKKP